MPGGGRGRLEEAGPTPSMDAVTGAAVAPVARYGGTGGGEG